MRRPFLPLLALVLAVTSAPAEPTLAPDDEDRAVASQRVRYDDEEFASVEARDSAWEDPDLTYFFQNGTADIADEDERQAFRDGLALWAEVTPLTFTEVTTASAADIVIKFATGSHGDSAPFDGVSRVLAHAFYPPPTNTGPIAGDAHFDDAESWTLSTRSTAAQPIDLVTVAAHEFGHSLGLAHSRDDAALMAPYYSGSHRFLAADDIAAIQALYGAGGAGTPSISVADRSIVEGHSETTSMRFKLTLSAAAEHDVTIRFTTSDGSATAPDDYRAKNVTATILAGRTARNVVVKVVGDTLVEPDETFTVTLSSAVGASIADGSATGSITDDD